MRVAARANAARAERLEARLNPEQKELFRLAAGLEGQTVTDFVIAAAQSAAERAIERHKVLRLTAEQTQAFADAFLNPREPSEVLRRYARRERELFGE